MHAPGARRQVAGISCHAGMVLASREIAEAKVTTAAEFLLALISIISKCCFIHKHSIIIVELIVYQSSR